MNNPSQTLPLIRGGQGGVLLALDYGGTNLSAAIAAPGAREWLGRARVPSPPLKDARYDRDTMLALARQLLGGKSPASIGVSFGGPVDAKRGRVILSHHVPGWEDVPLRDQLQKEFGAPVSIDNDANVAALGEYKFGAGQGCASLFYVTVSTGVGGGWVLDGKIFHGADSMAGEIGHTIVDPNGPLCICGRMLSPPLDGGSDKSSQGESMRRRGCVESLASGPAIARDARERLTAESKPPASFAKHTTRGRLLDELAQNHLDAITAEMVARAANDGDELAQEILDDAARALGFGIGTAITLMDPERIVIGGGVSKSGDRWWRAVRQAARANTLPQMRVDIIPAALGDDAPLWGAVALAESVVGKR